jgi:hypothetical protein
MRRFVWLLLIVLVANQVGAAPPGDGNQDDAIAPVASPTRNVPLPLQVAAPTQAALPFDRVVYVLDTSGSMYGALDDAIAVTGVFASDGFKASVFTFDTSFVRWSGVQVPCDHLESEDCGGACLPEEGWCWLPSHQQELYSYLDGLLADGGTSPGPAIEHAVKTAPSGALVVFVSDGLFEGQSVAQAAEDAMNWRQQQKLAPVRILVWSTGKTSDVQESLVELAKVGGAGLWRADVRMSGPW